MDHAYPLDQRNTLPPELGLVASRMASFLGVGGRAIVLTGPPNSGKTALMEHLLSGLSGLVTRVRGGHDGAGPPLDLAAMLRQMGEPAPDVGDEAGLFLRTLAVAAYDEYSAVLAVDDAHALSPETLQVLARVPGLGGSVTPGMTLVLAGEPSLLDKLAEPGLEVFGNSRRTLLARVPSAASSKPWQPPPVSNEGHAPHHDTRPGPAARARIAPGRLARHGRDLALIGAALITGAGLATLYRPWSSLGGAPAQTVAVVAAPAAFISRAETPRLVTPLPVPTMAAPSIVVPARIFAATATHDPVPLPPAAPTTPPADTRIVPAESPSVPAPGAHAPEQPTLSVPAQEVPVLHTAPEPDMAHPPGPIVSPTPAPTVLPSPATGAQLRREFDSFLDRAGPDTAKLSPSARAALWREFVQWRVRNPAAPARAVH